jgi:hypothetical protein
MHTFSKRGLAAFGVGVIVVAGATAGFAYWTQSGGGAGSATTGTTGLIDVHQTSTVGGLYPGGPTGSLSGNFTNGNAHVVTISSVTAVVHTFSSQTDSGKPPCTQADYTIGGTASGSVVPVGTGVGAWSGLTVAMVNGGLNQDNCKTVVVTIDYSANA